MDGLEQHNHEVETIQTQIRSFYARKQKVKIYHGATNSTRDLGFDPAKVVDVSNLTRVLRVDTDQQYAVVEPNVPMDKLVVETLKYGLIPPVVMEFPGITVGGGIQGGAGESSSFRYGLFQNICSEYEVVLADGQKVVASATQHADLYHGIACSYGSLGIITSVTLRLIPSHRYVRVQYQRVPGFREAVKTIKKQTSSAVDFVEGIMLAKDHGVVVSGSFSDQRDRPVVTFRQPWNEWFYLHARKVTLRRDYHEELVPLIDYLFRYDRGAFWTGRFGFTLFRVPFNRLTRFVTNGLLKTRTLFKFLHASHLSQRYLVQDIALPAKVVPEFMEFIDKRFGIYPLWMCPLPADKQAKLSGNYLPSDHIISVGVYGECSKDYTQFVSLNKQLECQVTILGGRKWLYAHSYYSQKEFWQIYDKLHYDQLRKDYRADSSFPDLYEKIIVKHQYQPSIMAGFMGIIRSPFRLRR